MSFRWYRVGALLLKYWYITRSSIDRVFDIFYWPIIGLIIFGFTTLYIEDIANLPSIFIFLMGGTMMWALFERVQRDIGVYILEDFWSRNVANTFATPITTTEIFVSVSLFGFLRSVLSFLVMVVLAKVAYGFNLFQGGAFSMIFIIPLFIFAWALGLFVAGMIFRFGVRIQVFAWSVTYLLQPVAMVYYPIETLPQILQQVSYAFPLMYVFEGFRMAYDGVFSSRHLAIAIVLACAYYVVCYMFFLKSMKKARISGFLTKH